MFRAANMIKSACYGIKVKHNFSMCKNIVRNSSVTTWNKDWKPGPYPRTEEDKIAAAKKYHMIPEDYEPYPEEEGYGDYPMFRKVHMETRNPHEPFDWESLKRNYCEPMHPDFDICVEDKVNFDREFKTPLWKQFIYLSTGVTLYVVIMYWDITRPTDLIMVPKQYPRFGNTYYTFEPAE